MRWKIDPSHSGVHFTVRHMVISTVRGAFSRFQGELDFDEKDPAASKVEVTIEASSIDTREPDRDKHLRSAEFFDVEKYPNLRFVSTRVEKVKGKKFSVKGDLTLRGVTKPVTLEAELTGTGKDPWGNQRIGFSATSSIDRRDFGLTWNQALETGGLLVGEKVEITLDVEAIAAAGKEKAA